MPRSRPTLDCQKQHHDEYPQTCFLLHKSAHCSWYTCITYIWEKMDTMVFLSQISLNTAWLPSQWPHSSPLQPAMPESSGPPTATSASIAVMQLLSSDQSVWIILFLCEFRLCCSDCRWGWESLHILIRLGIPPSGTCRPIHIHWLFFTLFILLPWIICKSSLHILNTNVHWL